jgi:hypothetical protein
METLRGNTVTQFNVKVTASGLWHPGGVFCLLRNEVTIYKRFLRQHHAEPVFMMNIVRLWHPHSRNLMALLEAPDDIHHENRLSMMLPEKLELRDGIPAQGFHDGNIAIKPQNAMDMRVWRQEGLQGHCVRTLASAQPEFNGVTGGA